MAKKRVVAIDIGTYTAKMVQIEQSSAAVRLTHAGVVTYTDKDDTQQVAESIRHLWASLGSTSKKSNPLSLFNRNAPEVVLALPRSLVSTKRLANLPIATDDQLASIVAIAAESELPFRVEEAIFTYHDVRQTPDATSVELISTRRASVTGYLDYLEQIGVSASAVTPSMIAIAETAANSGCTKPTFVVDIGASQTDFCFVEGGVLRFSRSFRLGGDNLSEHISQALNVDRETAAEEKRHIPADEAPTSTWTAQLLGELQRSIAAATAHRASDSFDATEETDETENFTLTEIETELWLCGGGARVPNLAATLEAELGIPTSFWNPLHAIEQQSNIKIEPQHAEAKAILEEWGDTLAVPLGVGFSALNATLQPSLLPKEAAETLTQTTRQRQIFATAGLGVLIVGGLLFGGYTLQRSQKHRTEMVDARLANYAQPVAAAQAQLGRELALTEMLAHNISPLDILHALSEMFRDRTQVAWTNFNIINLHEPETARITFNLEGASHEAINNLIRALNRSGTFTNVRPGEATTISQNRKQIFQVQVRCNLTTSAVRAFAKKRYPMPQPQIDEPAREAELQIDPPKSNTLEPENKKTEKDE
ncbi:hypothetical protein C6499_08750 [Candidatus Poribacteria bacterium]|nr:MAG: hypothetical protein C6499_08750 [Candidatus Poribacteria bacterium]